MTETFIFVITLVVLTLLLLAMIYKALQLNALLTNAKEQLAKKEAAITQREIEFQQELQVEVKQAQKRSSNMQRNVLKGQIGEQFTPFIAGFPYNPSDCKFMGDPIDYIIFQNLHEHCDGNVPIEQVQVIIAEVKTGNRARLNKRQKIIRQVIENGQVSFRELRIRESDETGEIGVTLAE